jgi:hypothetical protein
MPIDLNIIILINTFNMKQGYLIVGKYISDIKPTICPACGSKKVAEILYGLKIYSQELRKKEKKGEIVLGGCCIIKGAPSWMCVRCKTNIYKRRK